MNTSQDNQDTTVARKSVRTPIALGVVAAGICAYGGGLIVDNTVTLGSWAAGLVAVSIATMIGRSAIGSAIQNSSGMGEDLWKGISASPAGQFLSKGRSGKVMYHVSSLGAWTAMLFASAPMATEGATVANVTLSVGVATAALTALGVMEKLKAVRVKEAKEEQDPGDGVPANRKRLGM